VIEQARHVCETTAVRDAWARGQQLAVHGWIYGLGDGRLHDIGFVATQQQNVEPMYHQAVRQMSARSSA
jgi:carbonic anhydrase